MGNPIWFIFWLIVFWFVSFIVAFFCAFFYIVLLPFSVCISPLSGLCDMLLQCVQFPHYCAKAMMEGKSPF